jgi:glycosyltransferase involved in cell wall biosynthesis
VLVNYESVRALLRESRGPELEIRQIPYASELAFRGTTPRAPVPDEVARLEPAGAPLILSVSRHDPRKGVDVLLRALAGLADSGVPFRACLLGLGPIINANRSLLARLGLERQVLITGAVADVGPYLAHADVFVLPSLEEGSGSLSLLEALQSGLPIVASRCDGIPEDVRIPAGPGAPTPASTGEDAAVLVEPGNEQALQDALARVLSDASLRSRLGSRARSIFEQRFSAQGFAAALRDTYADLGVRVT